MIMICLFREPTNINKFHFFCSFPWAITKERQLVTMLDAETHDNISTTTVATHHRRRARSTPHLLLLMFIELLFLPLFFALVCFCLFLLFFSLSEKNFHFNVFLFFVVVVILCCLQRFAELSYFSAIKRYVLNVLCYCVFLMYYFQFVSLTSRLAYVESECVPNLYH